MFVEEENQESQDQEEQQEESSEEQSEEQDEEVADEQAGDESGEESESEEGEDSEEEGDDLLDWNDWAAQYELPDGIDGPEKLATSYKESLTEMKRKQKEAEQISKVNERLQSLGFNGGVEEFLETPLPTTTPPPQYQASGYQQQGQPTFRSLVQNAEQQGLIPTGTADEFAGILPLFDLMFNTTVGGLNYITDATEKNIKQFGAKNADDVAWRTFMIDNKKFSDKHRPALQKVKNKHNFDTYEEAAWFLKGQDPEFYKEAFGAAENRGKKKGLRFRGSGPKKKGRGKSSSGYARYLDKNGELNQEKLLADVENGTLTDAKADEIIKRSVTMAR